MPIYRATPSDAEEVVAKAEANGETVTSVSADGDGVWITTSTVPQTRSAGGRETR